jgi:hypothetical protein
MDARQAAEEMYISEQVLKQAYSCHDSENAIKSAKDTEQLYKSDYNNFYSKSDELVINGKSYKVKPKSDNSGESSKPDQVDISGEYVCIDCVETPQANPNMIITTSPLTIVQNGVNIKLRSTTKFEVTNRTIDTKIYYKNPGYSVSESTGDGTITGNQGTITWQTRDIETRGSEDVFPPVSTEFEQKIQEMIKETIKQSNEFKSNYVPPPTTSTFKILNNGDVQFSSTSSDGQVHVSTFRKK